MSLIDYFFETEPVTEMTLEGTVLPNFPKFTTVDSESIWRILDDSKKLTKILGAKPSTRIGKDIKVTYKIDNRWDSEDWPTHSPIKVFVHIKEKDAK